MCTSLDKGVKMQKDVKLSRKNYVTKRFDIVHNRENIQDPKTIKH